MSERPYQPFYKPYGMTDEEYEYEQRIAAEKLEQWEQEQNESNLLDAPVSRNFGGVRFHKISPPRNNPSKRIPKHNDIINKEVKMKGLKNFELEGLKLLIIQNFGSIDNFYQFLDSEQNRGTISRQNKSDWKKKIEKAFNQPDLNDENREAFIKIRIPKRSWSK